MSKISINKNNLAIEEIDKAIVNYDEAIKAIKKNNNNSKVTEIISLIDVNKKELLELKNSIININTQINNKLNALKKEEEIAE